MRVVIISYDFRAYFPPRIKHFGEFLRHRGDELHVVELFSESICYQFISDDFGHLPHHVLFQGRYDGKLAMAEVCRKIAAVLDEVNPDVVITSDVNFPSGAEVLRWTQRNRRGMVIYTDSMSHTFRKNVLVRLVKNALLRGVGAVLCPSSAWDESMKELGFAQERIFYGLNTADNAFWGAKVANTSFPELPKQYFLTLGRQVKMKNLQNFAYAYLRYCAEGGTMPLVMVGEGYCHQEITDILKDCSQVTFLPFQDREKVREIFVQARALFLPSYKIETWGMVVNEAMAAGVPVAVSNQCGCATTIVKPGENGFIFDPDDQHAMVKAMQSLEKMSSEEWQRFSDHSRRIIAGWGVERFSQGAYDACRYAAAHQRRLWNPMDYLIMRLWQGRIASDDL